eukprot:3805061-Pleurochrysis_carterae.AAC.1
MESRGGFAGRMLPVPFDLAQLSGKVEDQDEVEQLYSDQQVSCIYLLPHAGTNKYSNSVLAIAY